MLATLRSGFSARPIWMFVSSSGGSEHAAETSNAAATRHFLTTLISLIVAPPESLAGDLSAVALAKVEAHGEGGPAKPMAKAAPALILPPGALPAASSRQPHRPCNHWHR